MAHQAFNEEMLEDALRQMRSEKSEVFDAGYRVALSKVQENRYAVLKTMQTESNGDVRAALIEILGRTNDPSFIGVFKEECQSQHVAVKLSAFVALQSIDPKSAKDILQQWRITKRRQRQ